MSGQAVLLRGVVRNGVVVPAPGTILPEGAEVELTVRPFEFTPEERAEFEAWEQASAAAWRWIEELERQEGVSNNEPG